MPSQKKSKVFPFITSPSFPSSQVRGIEIEEKKISSIFFALQFLEGAVERASEGIDQALNLRYASDEEKLFASRQAGRKASSLYA